MGDAQLSPEQVMINFYNKGYNKVGFKHDSPDFSRTSIIRNIKTLIDQGLPTPNILDIGSGPQPIEKQLFDSKIKIPENLHFYSLDLANIRKSKLLARKYHVEHVTADGSRLPFSNSSLGLVFSNHAIDFMPSEAIDEVYRVLADKGIAVFYFHHPSMIPKDLSVVENKDQRNYWSHLKNTKALFSTEKEIKDRLKQSGFLDVSVNLNTDRRDNWWEVVAKKSPSVNPNSL